MSAYSDRRQRLVVKARHAMLGSVRWTAILGVFGLLLIAGGVVSADIALPTTINTDTVLDPSQTYRLQGYTRVEGGVRLECPAGTVIKAPHRVVMTVYGKLLANGTPTSPVVFTWADAGKKWGGIEFRGTGSSASVLVNCRIEHAGNGGHGAAIICLGTLTTAPSPTLRACEILDSAGAGVRSIGGAPKLDNCLISGSAGAAVLNSLGGYVYFVTPCRRGRNGSNTVTFDSGGHGIIFPQSWRRAGFPYRILGTVGTRRGGRITIQPGVELRMGNGVFLIADRGPIRARGTRGRPIVIRGTQRWRGQWGGIFIKPGGGSSLFRHCHVSHGGAKTCCSGAAAHLAAIGATRRGGVTIQNCSFTAGAGPGIWLEDTVATITGTKISDHIDMGLVTLGTGRLTVENSEIRRNGRAGCYHGGSGFVELSPDNSIVGNGQFDVVNMSTRNINARGNTWGVTTRRAIARRIFDGADSPGLGRVWFWPAAGASTSTVAAATSGLAITSATAVAANAGTVQITYALSAPGDVEAEVLNIAGRPVRRLAAQDEGVAGLNTLLWDGKSDTGLSVPSGRYLIRLRATSPAGEQAQATATAIVPAQ